MSASLLTGREPALGLCVRLSEGQAPPKGTGRKGCVPRSSACAAVLESPREMLVIHHPPAAGRILF